MHHCLKRKILQNKGIHSLPQASCTKKQACYPKQLQPGFSLMEMLIVLALFALAASLVVTNFDSLIDSYKNKNAENILWEALEGARSEAIALQKSTHLLFDPEKQVFKIEDLEHNLLKEYPIKDQHTFKIDIHARLPSRSLGDARSPKASDEKLPFILFTAQGFSPPVMLTIEQNNIITHLTLDPFSTGNVFESENPPAP